MWSFFSFSVCVVTAAQCGRRAGRLVIGRQHVRDHRCTASRRGVSARDPNTSGTEALARAIGEAKRSCARGPVHPPAPSTPPMLLRRGLGRRDATPADLGSIRITTSPRSTTRARPGTVPPSLLLHRRTDVLHVRARRQSACAPCEKRGFRSRPIPPSAEFYLRAFVLPGGELAMSNLYWFSL